VTTDFRFCGRVGAVKIFVFWNWFRSGLVRRRLSQVIPTPERNQFQKSNIVTAPTRPQNLKSVVTHIQKFTYYSTLVQTNVSPLQSLRDQYVYIHVYIYVHIHTYIHANIYTYMYIYICVYIHKYINMYMYVYCMKWLWSWIFTDSVSYLHSLKKLFVYTYMYT